MSLSRADEEPQRRPPWPLSPDAGRGSWSSERSGFSGGREKGFARSCFREPLRGRKRPPPPNSHFTSGGEELLPPFPPRAFEGVGGERLRRPRGLQPPLLGPVYLDRSQTPPSRGETPRSAGGGRAGLTSWYREPPRRKPLGWGRGGGRPESTLGSKGSALLGGHSAKPDLVPGSLPRSAWAEGRRAGLAGSGGVSVLEEGPGFRDRRAAGASWAQSLLPVSLRGC
ncbi:uncharacterized protein [Petaurus breviceps papuanus]|uniref:uncharacterized protein n=1 Tax=Petaurus breviceps papuanus TaxID=3040969 RepID=UPI0036DA46BE